MKKKDFKFGKILALVLAVALIVENPAFAAEIRNTEIPTTEEGETSGEIETPEEGEVELPEEGEFVNLEEGNFEIRWVEEKDYVYTGEEIKPEVTVYDVTDEENPQQLEETCYEVLYENNTDAGTAKVIVTGVKENGYQGTLEKEFEIRKKQLKDLTITAGTTYYYTGKDIKPTIKVKNGDNTLTLGKDYTVAYFSCKELGTAKATVTGIGSCEGTKTLTYTIKLGKIAISKISAVTYDKIKVTWNKVTGASGYKVYRSTSSKGTYKLVKTITSGSTVSYTDTGLTNGKTYYYKVRAYRTVSGVNKYTSYSSVKSQRAQVAQAKIASVKSNSYTSIKITWNKVSSANGYKIYRSTSEKGTYTGIGYTKTGLTFTDTKRTTGKTYYYKVRAYRYNGKTRYYGNSSAAVSGKASLAKVKITSKASSTTSKAKLVWEKVTGASGYQIYRSTSKTGTYTCVKTITSGSTLTWTNTGLSNKNYYYKIRAYRNVSGKKVYGSFSSIYTKYKNSWKYVNGYKLYYDANGKVVKDVDAIIGKQSSYYIKVNRKACTVTVYAKDGDNGYIIPVKAFACSVGKSSTPTPKGTFYTPAKYRWKLLMGPSYGQYSTRITGGILFHSVAGRNMTSYNLSAYEYNKLGSPASHGCVRLCVRDAKWIYDNCKLKTKVTIYDSSNPGPLGKPATIKIPAGQTWDPTDPAVKK